MKFRLPNVKQAHLIFSLVAGSALLAGCAGTRHHIALDPVGPAPSHTAKAASGQGSLIVFSAYDVNVDVNYDNAYAATYSSYNIYSPDGKLFKKVANCSRTWIEHPQQVELPAGQYNVVANSEDCGRVTVPVVISANQTTVLHLNADTFWPQLLGLNNTNAVRLPSGQLIGWRAASENTATP